MEASSMQDVLMLEKIGNVAVLTLNRPEVLNAINMDMRKGLADYFKGFAEDDDVRAVVLTGAGRAFSSGGDIKGWKDRFFGKARYSDGQWRCVWGRLQSGTCL